NSRWVQWRRRSQPTPVGFITSSATQEEDKPMCVPMLVASIALFASADAVPEGEERLQGEWTALACEVGKDAPDEIRAYAERIRKTMHAGKAWVRFDAGKFTLALWKDGDGPAGKYEYDASRKPARLALITNWREDPRTNCIVQVEGNTLTLAWRPGNQF